MSICRLVSLFAILAGIFWTSPALADELSFHLPDLDGIPVKVETQVESCLTVICFLGTECPLARLYASRLNELSTSDPKVKFIGVCSNQQDSVDDLRAFRDLHELKFPLVKDVNNVVADQFNAQRTPEVVVLDQNLKVQYRGRIDDQYQPGVAKSAPHRNDLQLAISESLAKKPVTIASTEPEGCLIGRVKDAANPNSQITYANQISRLLQNHCSECHREGQIGPMELTDYDEVVGWAEMILEVVEDNRMPPWHADPAHGEFVNERRMTVAEKEMLKDWVAAKAPLGDITQLPPPRQFAASTEWRLPRKPDYVVQMRDEPFAIPAEGTVEYQYFVVDPGFKEDKWITSAEILPGNRSVLHHSIVFVRPPDGASIQGIGWLAAYVPGQSAPSFNPKFGRRIPAGSKFVFQQHYTPIGKPTTDMTRIGLIFGDEQEIENEVFTLLAMEQDFMIPPGADNHPVSAKFRSLPKHGNIMGISPHMHYRGKSFEMTAKLKRSESKSNISSPTLSQTLLSVPKYDFNWQHIYQPKDPIPLDNIESLEFVAAFDNSANNPANPDPSQHVIWGDQTWEEMAVAFVVISQPREFQAEVDPAEVAKQKLGQERYQKFIAEKTDAFADDYFKRFDTDADGQISRAELPRSVRDHGIWRVDRDGDGTVTREEISLSAEQHFQQKYPFESFLD